MKVAIDATPLTLSSGGIARYTAELSVALASLFPEDDFVLLSDQPFSMPAVGEKNGDTSGLRYSAAHLSRRADVSPVFSHPPNLQKGSGPRTSLERRWWLWGVAKEMARQRAGLFHGTHFSVPWLPLRPSVVTVHDLSPWRSPSWQQSAGRLRRLAPYQLRLGLATMVITPTEAVRQEAIEHFRLSPQRVVAVPLAASPHFQPCPEDQSAVPYFLFVGTLEPRKNVETLVEAWREVRRTCAVDLVLAGRRREDGPEIAAEPGIRVLGEVADSKLPGLYSGALACLYPSRYEGFGLPVLEAMQCGAAVIASRDPAVTEVAGGAAVQVDADHRRGWIEAMVAAATQPDWREALRSRSLARAKAFSWQETARKTREVYAEAIHRFTTG